MADTFTFRESWELLKTNPKTFLTWLKNAGIDRTKQVDLADPRKKYITRAQLQMLASTHGRELPQLDEEPAPAETVTLATLAEHLTTLEQQTAVRLDQLTGTLQQVLTLVQELGSQGQDQPVTPVPDAPDVLTSSSAPSITSPKPVANKASTPKKKTAKGKPLPRTLIPLHVFAQQHHVSPKAADHASKSEHVTVQRGRWLYQSRYVTEALAVQGQQEFYARFHIREGFTSCERCPHEKTG